LPPVSRADLREPIDVVGAVLLAIGISTLLLMFNQLQNFGRQPLSGIALLGIAGAALSGFIYWEHRTPQPIVKLEFFRSAAFAAINLASVLVYLTSFSVILFGPYYLVRVAGLSVPIAGGLLGVSFLGNIFASPLAGWLLERVPAARLATLGGLVGGVGLVMIGGWQPGATGQPLAIIASLLAQGFGVGLFQVANMDIVMRTLPPQHRGVAGSIAMLSRSLGVVTGATALTLLFHAIETFSGPGGEASTETFLAGFKATFVIAGTVSALAGLLVLLAPKLSR
jgi:MFS family permease